MKQQDQTLWIQVSAGRGPAECALAVLKLTEHLMQAGKKQGLVLEMTASEAGPKKDTLNSALLCVHGVGGKDFAASYEGSLLWICKSPFRPGHKRKNWFVQVSILGMAETFGQLQEKDVQFETLKAGGPGGQHVNKTESAVRALHKPSGLVVLAREERSQHRNKKLALARLAAKLEALGKEAGNRVRQSHWEQHLALERGNPVRVFEGEKFKERKR